MLFEPSRPPAIGRGLGWQVLVRPFTQRREILEQDLPRHRIDRQVMDDDQQTVGPPRPELEQRHPQNRPRGQVEAGLEPRCQGLDLGTGIRQPAEVEAGAGHLPGRGDALLPPRRPAGVAPAQRVVVRHQPGHRPAQGLAGHRRLQLEHPSVVVVLRIGRLQLEEAVLNRRQRQGAGDRPLLGRGDRRRAGDRGQLADRRVQEDVPRRQAQAGAIRPRDDLNAEDRLAAEIEVVVVQADAIDPQDPRPDVGQGLLRRRARRSVVGRRRGVRNRQRGTVELAVGGQRQGVEPGERRRHHIVRQALLQERPQLRGGRPVVRRHHVGRQPPAAGRITIGEHGAGLDPQMTVEPRLDLRQLDAIAADLHLVVAPAEERQLAAAGPARQVTRAIEAPAGIHAQGIGHEALGGQRRPAQVAAGHLAAAEVELAGRRHRHRHRRAGTIQQVGGRRRQRPADRRSGGQAPAIAG